jgi:hypothetical protein
MLAAGKMHSIPQPEGGGENYRLARAVGVGLHLYPHQNDQFNRSSGERRDLIFENL